MNSSVKFFEPTVIVVLPFAGFDWIRFSEAPEVVDELLLLPQAATPITRTAAATSAKTIRARRTLISQSPLPGWTVPRKPPQILCTFAGPLQLEALRSDQ